MKMWRIAALLVIGVLLTTLLSTRGNARTPGVYGPAAWVGSVRSMSPES